MNLINSLRSALASRKFKKSLSQINEYKTIEGWLTENEAYGLFTVANKLQKGATVVEIGSWKGKSTFCIAKGMLNGNIFCIDPFNADGEAGSKEIYESTKGEMSLLQQFENNLKGISDSVKIKPLKGYSNEFVGAVPNIDFLFIDGDHSIEGCKFDFENFSKNIKSGGFLAFHDYYADRKDLGPTWVIDNLVGPNPSFIHFESFDSLNVFKKIN